MVNKIYKYHYIYKTTNLVNNKYYYGMHSTDNLSDEYRGSGKILKASIKKYGIENFKFEILEYLPNRKNLKEREREVVNQEEVNNKFCMNLQLGGFGGFSEKDHKKGNPAANKRRLFLLQTDEEFRKAFGEKISKAVKDTYKKGRKSFYYKGQIGKFLNKKHTDETKDKMSKAKKEKGTKENNSQFGTMWITNGVQNKKIKKDSLIPQGWEKGRV